MPRDNFYTYIIAFTLIILIIAFYFLGKRSDKKEVARCNLERMLQFEGVVKNYSTNIDSESSTFNLKNDSTLYKIPRSSKEMLLFDGDTVQKAIGQNVYIVKHTFSSIFKNRIDTFKFECF